MRELARVAGESQQWGATTETGVRVEVLQKAAVVIFFGGCRGRVVQRSAVRASGGKKSGEKRVLERDARGDL